MTSRDHGGILRKDLLAGLTVAAIAIPQAMAYALIAGVDPRFGLYSAIIITAIASVLGSSAHLINGPTNAISLVVFSAIAFLDPGSEGAAFEAAFLLAIMVGVLQILVAVFKLGDLTRYISESVILGFMAGAAFLVALGQLGNLLGLKEQGTGHHHLLHRLWLMLTSGQSINWRALTVGLVTVVFVVGLRKLARRYHLPRVDMLLALILAALFTAACGWSQVGPDGKSLVSVVGAVPAGMPVMFHVPVIDWEWVRTMSGSALAIAMLGLLEALAIAKSIAHETRQKLNYNRQCLAEGVANLVGGFFQCFPGSGSLTRSAINYQAGAVTRFSGVYAAVAVAAVVMLFAPWARFIPKASLAGILLVTAAGLFDRARLKRTIQASRFDAGLVVATACAAVFVSVEFSILIGVGLSMFLFVPRAARLQAHELTITPDRTLRERMPTDPPCQKLVVLDLEGEFFFGAAPELDRYFDDLRLRISDGLRVVVLRVKRTRNPDIVCMERLEHFVDELATRGVTVLLAGVRAEFAEAMKNLHLSRCLPAERVFLEDPNVVGSATLSAVRYAYTLLQNDLCTNCPRRNITAHEADSLTYII